VIIVVIKNKRIPVFLALKVSQRVFFTNEKMFYKIPSTNSKSNRVWLH